MYGLLSSDGLLENFEVFVCYRDTLSHGTKVLFLKIPAQTPHELGQGRRDERGNKLYARVATSLGHVGQISICASAACSPVKRRELELKKTARRQRNRDCRLALLGSPSTPYPKVEVAPHSLFHACCSHTVSPVTAVEHDSTRHFMRHRSF